MNSLIAVLDMAASVSGSAVCKNVECVLTDSHIFFFFYWLNGANHTAVVLILSFLCACNAGSFPDSESPNVLCEKGLCLYTKINSQILHIP